MAIQVFPELTANGRDNLVSGTAQADQIFVFDQTLASNQGRNIIDTGTGDDQFSVSGSLISRTGGVNEITMGAGNNTFMVAKDMLAAEGIMSEETTNQVNITGISGETNSQVIIGGTLSTQTNYAAKNEFLLSGGDFVIDLGGVETAGGINRIQTDSEQTDNVQLTIRGDLLTTRGDTRIDVSGKESSFVEIMGNLENRGGSTNLRLSNQAELIIHGEVKTSGGNNIISAASNSGAADTITMHFGSHVLTSDAINMLSVAIPFNTGGVANITIAGGVITEKTLEVGLNSSIVGSLASDTIFFTIEQGIWTSGAGSVFNLITYTTSLTDISISGGINASEGATNRLTFSNIGKTHVSISGNIEADADSHNLLIFSTQHNLLELNGKVGVGALDIDGSMHYDVLSLSALNYAQFSNFYRGWLSDLDSNDAINSMNLEAIRVDIGRFTDSALNSLGWLDQLVDQHNSAYEGQIALELNIDRQGSDIQLGDLFTSNNGPSFSGLDMTGATSNTLEVLGSLSENGVDGGFLRVLGDEQDSVVLGEDWTLSQAGFVDETGLSYNVYSNTTDELLIQSSISIV